MPVYYRGVRSQRGKEITQVLIVAKRKIPEPKPTSKNNVAAFNIEAVAISLRDGSQRKIHLRPDGNTIPEVHLTKKQAKEWVKAMILAGAEQLIKKITVSVAAVAKDL